MERRAIEILYTGREACAEAGGAFMEVPRVPWPCMEGATTTWRVACHRQGTGVVFN
jgi:hypothetical protein